MEKGEENAQKNYSKLNLCESRIINKDESRQGEKLLNMFDEENFVTLDLLFLV